MKYIKVLILALLSTTLVGCFSNQQLNESTKFIGDWTLKGGSLVLLAVIHLKVS